MFFEAVFNLLIDEFEFRRLALLELVGSWNQPNS